MTRAAALLLAACAAPQGGDSAGPVGGSPLPTGTTGPTPTQPGVVCTVRDNALLFDCVATLPSSGAAAAYLEEPSGAIRPLASTQVGTRLDFVAWRLVPGQTYVVRVQPASGPELRTEIAPAAVPEAHAVAPVVSGSPSWDHLLIPHECGGGPTMLLLDDQARVVWYLEAAAGMSGAGLTAVDGFEWTEDDTVLAVIGRTRVREWSWTQEPILDLEWPGSLSGPVHHDIERKDGLTYVLTADLVTGSDGLDYVMDGVLVLGSGGIEVGRWSLADVYSPSGGVDAPGGFWGAIYGDAWDWAHSNGIHVEPDGDWLLSSRAHDTVIRVEGDLAAPDFGAVRWALSYDPASPLGSDFSFGGGGVPAGFQDQHHPDRDRSGHLTLFDNRGLLGEPSRATVWDLDEGGGSATLFAAWDLPEHCTVQGSLYQLQGSDHLVAACASSQTVYELAPGQSEPVASVRLPCAASGIRPLVVRAQPIAFED